MTTEGGARAQGADEPSSGADGRLERRPEPMQPISNWAIAAAAALVALVTGVLMWVLVGIANTPAPPPAPGQAPAPNPAVVIDAVRTALTAAAGTGGAAALLLAFRRQRHTEHAALEARYAGDADRAQREAQARTGAVTELYSRAVDQLGSEQAPVRLGGLYALERLAQDTPEQRQTIANVLCAYLRMPYTPPAGDTGDDQKQATGGEQARQEREVRLTAQRLLAHHLAPNHGEHPAERYWGELELDLTGALLIDLDFSLCRVGPVRFDKATFCGDARFTGATFSGRARFDEATFSGRAWFGEAAFSDDAWFAQASFSSDAWFGEANFSDDAWFAQASFSSGALFGQTSFSGDARFGQASFGGEARFDVATFSSDSRFDGARVLGTGRRVWPAGWVEAGLPGADGGVALVRSAPPSSTDGGSG